MPVVKSIQHAVRSGLCISCGACVSACPEGSIRMVLNERKGMFLPRILKPSLISGKGPEFRVCPAKGLNIERIGRMLYGDAPQYSMQLGWYREAWACHSNNPTILKLASSGGAMTEIANYLLEGGYVDGVTASKFVYGQNGPRTVSFIARSLDDLRDAQGSKYCPSTTNALVRSCRKAGGRYLFLGTPCQVGALRLSMDQQSELKKVFPYTMANFCGGYRDFREVDDILARNGMVSRHVTSFRFRGGGQPGSLLAIDRNGRSLCLPYPEYGRGSLLPKAKRCIFCVDGTGLLADFACGDAWIDRFANKNCTPWSILLLRSAFAVQTIHQMAWTGQLAVEPVSDQEVLYSQRFNLHSKITRQRARMRIHTLLGVTMPCWDMDLPRNDGNWLYEIRTLIGKLKLMLMYRLRYLLGLRTRNTSTREEETSSN